MVAVVVVIVFDYGGVHRLGGGEMTPVGDVCIRFHSHHKTFGFFV